jgi:hypothetical protein
MELIAGTLIIIKMVGAYAVGGFLLTFFNDKHVKNGLIMIGGKIFMSVKKVKGFSLENEHATVIGLTQHGKTYATVKTLEGMREGIIFFNSQHSTVGNGWVEATGANSPEQIIFAVKEGKKINFLPSDDSIDKMSKQLAAITNELYKEGRMSVRFVIDEVHLFWMCKDNGGKNALLRLATTGLGRGFKCVFLSQRPAKVDNTLYTQSTKHIIFALGKLDESYLKTNGFPVDEIIARTRNEKYNFIEFDQKQITGAYRI